VLARQSAAHEYWSLQQEPLQQPRGRLLVPLWTQQVVLQQVLQLLPPETLQELPLAHQQVRLWVQQVRLQVLVQVFQQVWMQ